MSSFLSIKPNYIDQTSAKDILEAKKWAELQINIGARNITRVWDKNRQEMRLCIYVPVFAIAQWIVENWWNILNEPSRTENLPKSSAILKHLPWIKRHCIRSADSALLLPNLYLYNDGHGIIATWENDDASTLPNMPAYFLDYGHDFLTQKEVSEALAQFVNNVLDRVEGITDERVNQLQSQWQAITSADSDEKSFCVTAARMGLHPYDPNEVTDEIADAICAVPGDADFPINRDLTEAAKPEVLAEQLRWVERISTELNLNRIPNSVQMLIPSYGNNAIGKPHDYGYIVARTIRQHLNLSSSTPIESVPDIAMEVSGKPLVMKDRNHLPGQIIKGIVGWSGDDYAVVAGPNSGREDNKRFLLARGLFHALYSCDVSQRLLTQAITWDQSASRAFAAELLAPQQALAAETGDLADTAQIDHLAHKFNVSARVVELQLQNADVELMNL
jgi:Zn-dependent peptidase ImmA (M78 family)